MTQLPTIKAGMDVTETVYHRACCKRTELTHPQPIYIYRQISYSSMFYKLLLISTIFSAILDPDLNKQITLCNTYLKTYYTITICGPYTVSINSQGIPLTQINNG